MHLPEGLKRYLKEFCFREEPIATARSCAEDWRFVPEGEEQRTVDSIVARPTRDGRFNVYACEVTVIGPRNITARDFFFVGSFSREQVEKLKGLTTSQAEAKARGPSRPEDVPIFNERVEIYRANITAFLNGIDQPLAQRSHELVPGGGYSL